MNFRYSPPVTGIKATVMSLFNGKSNDGSSADDIVYDVDRDGKQLFKEDIIANILSELERRKNERLPLEQQWRLNANFLCGNQYCDYNLYSHKIEQLEPVYDWLERETFNQIAPLIETRIANLKKINYRMKVNPRSNELDDYAKASVSTTLLQYLQTSSDFDNKKNTAIAWNELCGNCFFLSWWDKSAGEKYAVDMIVEADDNGVVNKREQVYYQGDLRYGLLTPYEVFPESIFKDKIDNQRSIIVEQVMSREDVYDLYGVDVDGNTIETFQLTPIASGGGYGYENTIMTVGTRTVDDAVKVITYFERPSRRYANGRLIIILNSDKLVYYGDLPYSKIPIVQMMCREVPGQFFGKSAIEDLIPRQRAYNGCLNRIHEYIKRIALNSMIAEDGSIDIEEFEENGAAPGAILTYRRGANPPQPLPNGVLPSEIMAERQQLKNDMEYIAGTSQLMVNGALPSGVTSGTAIENLMAVDNTRLSLTGDYIRNSIKNLAIVWLEIYKKYATTQRILNFVGKNDIGNVLVWSQNDINSYDIDYTTENELIMSEETQKQRFIDAFNMGLFVEKDGTIPERVKIRMLESMKLNNYSEIMSIHALQIQAAQRENSFFDNGIIPEVTEFDDHDVHLDEHMRYYYQMDFQLLKAKKPDYAQAFEDHMRNHKKALENAEQQSALAAMLQGGMQNG